MAQKRMQFTGIEESYAPNLPVSQTPNSLPEIRSTSILPEAVRKEEQDILYTAYLTTQEIEAQRVIGKRAMSKKVQLIEDAQESYIQLTGSLISGRDGGSADEEQHALVNAFTQVLVNDGANELYRSMKTAHSHIDRAATNHRRVPEEQKPEPKPEPEPPKTKVIEHRQLSLMERLRGKTVIEYER